MNPGYRQEVFNVVLAQLLQERGVVSAPESILKIAGEQEHSMPDVLVSFHGLRLVIEGEVDGQVRAANCALDTARRRVEQGIAHIGVGVVYPTDLRLVEFEGLKGRLMECELRLAIVTESGDTGFTTGGVDDLEIALRRTFEQLQEEDVVSRAVAILDEGVESFASVVAGKTGWVERLAKTLGIRQLPRRGSEAEEDTE